jgi:hypothetical protein
LAAREQETAVTNTRLLRVVNCDANRAATALPAEALSAVEAAFLRVMRARHPEYAWELEAAPV